MLATTRTPYGVGEALHQLGDRLRRNLTQELIARQAGSSLPT